MRSSIQSKTSIVNVGSIVVVDATRGDLVGGPAGASVVGSSVVGASVAGGVGVGGSVGASVATAAGLAVGKEGTSGHATESIQLHPPMAESNAVPSGQRITSNTSYSEHDA